jgi:hypothetical protein
MAEANPTINITVTVQCPVCHNHVAKDKAEQALRTRAATLQCSHCSRVHRLLSFLRIVGLLAR